MLRIAIYAIFVALSDSFTRIWSGRMKNCRRDMAWVYFASENSLLASEEADTIPARTRYSKGLKNLEEYRKILILDNGGIPTPTPTFEITRLEAIGKLRKLLHKCIQAEGCESKRGWVRCFERWIFHSGIMDDFKFHLPTGEAIEPFLPCGTSEKSYILLRRDLLMLEGMSEEGATKVAATITNAAQKVTKAVVSRFSSHTKEKVPHDALLQRVEVIRNKNSDHICLRLGASGSSRQNDPRIVAYQQQEYRVHSISGTHLAKLRNLWVNEGRVDEKEIEIQDELFYRDVFSLLTRYQALEGKGFQAAVPQAVYKELQRSFGITGELFASPLNCYFQDYFSAFPDTDSVFGSLGSFYDMGARWNPLAGGSFVGNPPFVQHGILTAASIIRSIIARAEAIAKENGTTSPPLSFVLFVPAWGHADASPASCSYFETTDGPEVDLAYRYIFKHPPGTDLHMEVLLAHPYLRGHMYLPSSEHCYVDGFQHVFDPPIKKRSDGVHDFDIRNDENFAGEMGRKISWREASEGKRQEVARKTYYRPVSFDTAMVVIQNDQGARKWPFTRKKEDRIREAWRAQAKLVQGGGISEKQYIPKFKRREEID